MTGDASFRSYLRVYSGDTSRVLMDAPPEHESVAPFIEVRSWMQQAGLRVPDLIAKDTEQGFLLLEDFGDTTWAAYLAEGKGLDPLFKDALRQIKLLQSGLSQKPVLPVFNAGRMHQECNLYLDWYLPGVVNYIPSELERRRFYEVISPKIQRIASLPYAPVHLDYHSRNLMLPDDGLPLGIIDFQDAVFGPVTYDLASLLYDCYQDYPESCRCSWSKDFFDCLSVDTAIFFTDFSAWHEALRLTAMQRHIKAIGIFSRLAYRDKKKQFLEEIALTRKHLLDELTFFGLDEAQIPLLYMA